MPKFDIHDIAATVKTDEENENALAYFSTIAFPGIAHSEIVTILKQNQQHWQSVWARKGEETDTFNYPAEVLKLAKNKKKNIVSLIVTGTSQSTIFMYELKEYANDFSFTGAHTLPEAKVIFVLFFVDK